MSRKVTKYETGGGVLFNTKEEADRYEELEAVKAEYENDCLGDVYHGVDFIDFYDWCKLHKKIIEVILKQLE